VPVIPAVLFLEPGATDAWFAFRLKDSANISELIRKGIDMLGFDNRNLWQLAKMTSTFGFQVQDNRKP